MEKITVADLTVDLIRKNIRNMHLSVYPPHGRIRIAVPIETTDEAIRLFIISKLGWIKQNQRKFNNQDRQSPREFIDRESHYFQGRRYLLRVTESPGVPKVEIKTKSFIDLTVRPDTSIEGRKIILHEWYRSQLKAQIPGLITKWETKLGVKVNAWGVKLMKTKWGTCTIQQKRIWVNLELAKKPLQCLEYIIVHEMIHLFERHHNERFIALMQHHFPQWQRYRDILNQLPISHAEWEY